MKPESALVTSFDELVRLSTLRHWPEDHIVDTLEDMASDPKLASLRADFDKAIAVVRTTWSTKEYLQTISRLRTLVALELAIYK